MKNKKLVRAFSIFALVTAFAACSNKAPETNDSSTPASVEDVSSDEKEMDDQSTEINQMSTESNDPQAANEQAPVEEKTEENENENENEEMTKDGVYVSTLFASNEGNPMEDIDSATCYEVNIEEDTLIVKGSIDYRETFEDYDNISPIENGEHKFKLAEDAVFQAVGGTSPGQEFTREEFLEYEKEVDNSGLALIIEVENGLVTSVSISS